ncbi:NAD(P)-dependent oxidoreductase [Polynucleobacter paneuropaeus]|nr:NAD(P)-dependent oxidoreductase [Polynucleobacter paneuropaeus]
MKPHRSEYDISGDVSDIISRLGADVQDLDNKTILITGGTGFFGRWLLQILCGLIVDKNFKINVYVVTRNPKKFLEQNLEYPFDQNINFICGDVVNFKLPNIKIDYLIHMATTAATETFGGEDQLKKLDLLYRGTRNTLELAVDAGVRKVLFTSSGVAYGPSTGIPFSEDMLQAPKTNLASSALGEGKRLAEYLVNYYAEKGGYSYSIARCFSFFGPYLPLDIHYAIGNFINDALMKEEIIVRGGGNELRSYLYIADAWVWLLKSLIHADKDIFNVGSSSPITISDLAHLVRDTLAPKKGVRILGSSCIEGNFSRDIYVPSNEKIKKKFNLAEWTALVDGLQKMGLLIRENK